MRSVPDMLRARARSHPERPFLWCGDDRLTYAETDERTDAVAAGLLESGVRPGDRVAVISGNRTEMLELFFALAKVGAIQVPLNIFLKGEFLRYQLADSQTSTLIGDAAGLAGAGSVTDELQDLKRVIALDDSDGIPYSRIRKHEPAAADIDLRPSTLMTIMYTSGTTGMPKGCMLPHGWYTTMPRPSTEAMRYTDGDILCTALPLFHAWAQGMVMGALYNGLEAVVDSFFSPATVVDRWRETGATVYAGVGMMGMAMLGMPESASDADHRLRCTLMLPFAPDEQKRFEKRFGTTMLSQLYGQTECGAISFNGLGEERRPGTMGRPSPFYEVSLVDDDDMPVPIGEIGEVVVRPREPFGMYLGYWRKPEATAEAWRNLWHHTGDLARADSDGVLTFVDRKKDALRRRGENVSSVQLELAITQHPAIAEAAVHGVPSPLTEDDIKACVVLSAGETLEPGQLFEFFKQNLPYFSIPRYVEVLPELPRNATLRVMKHLLRERGVTGETWDFEKLGFSVARDERR